MAFIAMPDENSYDILFYRNPGADMRLRADELDRALLEGTRAYHFGSLSLIQEPSRSATLEALEIARRSGALISFDVNYRPDLWSRDEARQRVRSTIPQVDVLKVNAEELELLTATHDLEAGTASLLRSGPAVCVATLGPGGSYFRVVGGGGHAPAFQVETVDATGCGDAFVAGLLRQLASADDWRDGLSPQRMHEMVRYANATAALTALTQGVIPALPAAQRVREFLAQQA
jgi:fructokinase